MRSIMAAMALLIVIDTAMADEPQSVEHKREAIAKAMETFTGTWEIIAVQPTGSTKEAMRLVFRKDRTYAALDKDGQELWAGTFEIDPTVQPSIWDHRSNEGQKSGADALGIYELDGDKLKLACVVGTWKGKQWTGKPRSTEFKLPSADVVLELRRLHPDK